MQFRLKDVITVAKALLEDPIEIGDAATDPYFWCLHCDATIYERNKKGKKTRNDFIHDTDCPCLVAQDLLTRIDNGI
jgi:hypothetical protein